MKVARKQNTIRLNIGLLFLGLLIMPSWVKAQSSYQIRGKSVFELRTEKLNHSAIKLDWQQLLLKTPAAIKTNVFDQIAVRGTNFVPMLYQAQELAFFCRWEVKMEKASKMPVKFRLGEVQYTERMEGKYE